MRPRPDGVETSWQVLKRVSDAPLVELSRGGCKAAFAVLHDRYRVWLMAYCQWILGERNSLEDTVQDTFLAAYHSLVASVQLIDFAPWLFRIAQPVLLTYSPLDRGSAAEFESVTVELAKRVQQRLALAQLVDDLQQLPSDQRLALTLTAFGLSPVEAAQSLDAGTDKVKALVFRGREALTAIRIARDVACTTIQHELATSRGGDLRRAHLRRPLSECDGCRAYVHRRHAALRRRPLRSGPMPGPDAPITYQDSQRMRSRQRGSATDARPVRATHLAFRMPVRSVRTLQYRKDR